MNDEPNRQTFIYAHIGDLHLTNSKEQNYKDLLSIIADIETGCATNIDMVFLPGDNADHGQTATYKILATALKMLSVPVYVIVGDHDMEQGGLENFNTMPVAQQLPFSININNAKCLFIDVCGNGKGGPDFRLGKKQISWLKKEMEEAPSQQQSVVIFMHTYPDDVKDKNEKNILNGLIAGNNVVLVDMGHTHYNEIANDGHTIFSATRSTGQIEEGPVGYSLISVDNNVVSWRFKLLDEPFPFVMITFPVDKHLATTKKQHTKSISEVRAVVMSSNKIKSVRCKIDEGKWMLMKLSKGKKIWSTRVALNDASESSTITVEATDESGRPGAHTIVYSAEKVSVKKLKSGSDEFRIGSWAENHIFGTQLGPNRNAKPH